MAPKVGEYYYALGTEEFGKVLGFTKKAPKKELPKDLLDKFEDGKFVILTLAAKVGEEDKSENFAVVKNQEFLDLFEKGSLRLLSVDDLKRIFPVADADSKKK